MSKESFLKEFYPIEAKDAIGSWLSATRHATQKWKGRLPENLARHQCQLSRYHDYIMDKNEPVLGHNADTCALCLLTEMEEISSKTPIELCCTLCPITKLLGTPCTKRYKNNRSLYENSLSDPTIMINTLRAIERYLLISELQEQTTELHPYSSQII